MPIENIPQTGDGSVISAAISGLVTGVSLIGLWLWRTRRGDNKSDDFQAHIGELVASFKDMAAAQASAAQVQAKRADDFAAERNKLMEEQGRLKARLEALEKEKSDMAVQIEALTELIVSQILTDNHKLPTATLAALLRKARNPDCEICKRYTEGAI